MLHPFESELPIRPATECVYKFTRLLHESEKYLEKKGKTIKTSRFPRNAWFNEDCKAAKKRLKNCAKQLKNNPSNKEVQKDF